MHLDTAMYVGGVDSIVLNNNTGVTGGFNGCIKDVRQLLQFSHLLLNLIYVAKAQWDDGMDRNRLYTRRAALI